MISAPHRCTPSRALVELVGYGNSFMQVTGTALMHMDTHGKLKLDRVEGRVAGSDQGWDFAPFSLR